jgi:23S rRNA pseudouridine1911/1915/1917 synthase
MISLLDRLHQEHPDTPKSRAKQWIVAGRVSVNGVVVRKPHHVLANPADTVELLDRHASTLNLGSGWAIHPRVTLLHLDASLAVVNKGASLISVPAPNCELSALSILADFLEGKLKPRDHRLAAKSIPAAWRRLEPLPVHRLDQYTSGVFCMALNPSAREHLIEQLKVHTMRREYVAFVEGCPAVAKGTWRQWLQLSPDEMRQHVVPEAQARDARSEAVEAITHYEVVREYPLPDGTGVVTQLRLRLETGRKHQIRVQAANAGLPLIGDRAYNPNYRAHGSAPIVFPRQALHAELLDLEHPEQPGKRVTFKAAWPGDMRELERALLARRKAK